MDMDKVYQRIAKRHGISADEVRREMLAVIDEAHSGSDDFRRELKNKGFMPGLKT